jgi:AcrR family transcriptional regulator
MQRVLASKSRDGAKRKLPAIAASGANKLPAAADAPGHGKAPRTARGERTLRKILDAALAEFGELGFGEASIVGITRRAKVALGTFYTYFDSKDEVFRALVQDMSGRVREHVAPSLGDAVDTLDGERRALAAFLRFAAENKQVYRIIDEAEFVDPAGFRAHYENTAARIVARIEQGIARGELRREASPIGSEVIGWALMGANVFLGLRFAVWDNADLDEVAEIATRLNRQGLEQPPGNGR